MRDSIFSRPSPFCARRGSSAPSFTPQEAHFSMLSSPFGRQAGEQEYVRCVSHTSSLQRTPTSIVLGSAPARARTSEIVSGGARVVRNGESSILPKNVRPEEPTKPSERKESSH